MTLKLLAALLAPILLASLKDVLHRLLMAIVGRRVVEYMVVSALRWLAKRTDSQVDDTLVELVVKALEEKDESGAQNPGQAEQSSVDSAKSVPEPPKQ